MNERLPDFVPGQPVETSTIPTVSTETPKSPEQETVRITGRVGYQPKFDVLASGTHRARFTIAEHAEAGETTWHQVYSTKTFAERIQKAGMERGQLVEVAGRWQTQQQKDKDGNLHDVKRFYAFGVRVLGGQKP